MRAMPEGPQVKRTGNVIARFIGQEIHAVRHAPSRKIPLPITLPATIEAVEVVGKNIFARLNTGEILYNHMLMWGSWRTTCEYAGPKPKRLNTCFVFSDGCLGYFGGGVLKILTEAEAAVIKNRLGPDVMNVKDWQTAFARAQASPLPIGEVLLSQELVAGIGNIYKSEGLFASRVHPLRSADQLKDTEWAKLYAFLWPQMIADVGRSGPISTTPVNLRKAGTRNFVYRRWHQPCLWCSTKIERIYQGSGLKRSTYWCPRCQAA